jgi:hypothetical protein
MARQKYKKKPEVYYAVQYSGTNEAELVEFCPECVYDEARDKLLFHGGIEVVEPMMWVVHDNAMVYSLMSDEQFNAYFSLDTGPPV